MSRQDLIPRVRHGEAALMHPLLEIGLFANLCDTECSPGLRNRSSLQYRVSFYFQLFHMGFVFDIINQSIISLIIATTKDSKNSD